MQKLGTVWKQNITASKKNLSKNLHFYKLKKISNFSLLKIFYAYVLRVDHKVIESFKEG